ncbi:MAG TPA: calcium-binding protein [Allosphingosinicella sp.]|nr:calcium-binding protein [Allosphingosinicella sp.]
MARPFWLKLFGPNGPTTFAEFRAALMNAPIGQALGDGQVLTNIRALLNLPAGVERPTHDTPRDPSIREQFLLNLTPLPDPGGHGDSGASAEGIAAPTAPGPENAAENLAGEDGGRSASLFLNGIVSANSMAGGALSPFARLDTSGPFMLLGDMQSGLVIDTRNKSLMQGGPGDYALLGAGPNDVVELNGDYSAGFEIAVPALAEQIVARGGNDYNLIAGDGSVAAGGALIVNAMPLGGANHMIFDGSAESDGRFLFYGSESGDVFLGGAGNDLLYGLGGADLLSGGGGRDTFAYHDAAQSSGADYDILADFDPTADRIDLEVSVGGFDAAIQGGALSSGSFAADLSAALSGLGAGRAVLYAPDAGDLAGNVFLVVDANGIAGYQEGEDYVFALAGATLDDLSGQTGFFI